MINNFLLLTQSSVTCLPFILIYLDPAEPHGDKPKRTLMYSFPQKSTGSVQCLGPAGKKAAEHSAGNKKVKYINKEISLGSSNLCTAYNLLNFKFHGINANRQTRTIIFQWEQRFTHFSLFGPISKIKDADLRQLSLTIDLV